MYCISFFKVIKNGENGFIAKQVSPNELKDVIHEFLILDDKKIRQIKENAFETAKKFSIENTVATLKVKYNELYEEIKNDK